MAIHILNMNKKGQINFGFIIAILLLVVLIITATTGILDLLPIVKHEAEASALEPRAAVVSKLLLEDPGYPADWVSTNVERVGLLHYNSFEARAVLGRLNSTKISYVNGLSYNTIAHQLGLKNETSFRLRIMNGSTIMDINGSFPGSTSVVYVMKRMFSIDGTSLANVTLEVWE